MSIAIGMKFKKQCLNQLLKILVFTNLNKIYINGKMTLFLECIYFSRRDQPRKLN